MIVGIDLGTTNSLVAVWEHGAARLLPNALGEVFTPSCVSIDDDGTVLVGRAARERMQTHPHLSTGAFKRHMGTNAQISLGRRTFRAEELSALLLRALRDDAEAALGKAVTGCVITVPAYFSEAQRRATRAAGQLAGLHVERLLNEPTAAALAYGVHQRGRDSRLLVFDLGGGTFDVSLLDMYDGVMEVRASGGDTQLGGDDFTTCIVDQFMERHWLSNKWGRDARFMQRLRAQAEHAKRALSTQDSAIVAVRAGHTDYTMEVTPALLDTWCAPLLARLCEPAERALRDARWMVGDLDAIVLAGGASRMPVVRRMAASMFGREPSCEIDPDQVVALGAAVQAGLRGKDASLADMVMTDAAPYSLGIATARVMDGGRLSSGHFDVLIERNAAIPVSRVKQYSTIFAGQTELSIDVFQGEGRMAADNLHLGTLTIPLGEGQAEARLFDVRFTYDSSGLLQVEATFSDGAESRMLLIEGNPGMLSEAQIADKLAALAELKFHPSDRLGPRTLLARANRLYEQLREAPREALGAAIAQFSHTIDGATQRDTASACTQFEQLLDALEPADVFGEADEHA